ncbi:Cell cycle serine/threonine-protein kinase cdc5/MSD2 [Coemansia sp. Benny D115]|nr:Cell cycle serine/threonine-protein kinase cdc5/MSD2 [Coemansia sp. Benny D115]
MPTAALLPKLQEQPLSSNGMFISPDGVSLPVVLTLTKPRSAPQQYRIISLLGHGAFGRCYEVRKADEPSGRHCACKTLDKAGFTNEKIIERVKCEMKVMKRLPKHENVVEFYDMFEDPERLYIMMELCTSRTLYDLLQRRKRLTEFETRYFMGQLSKGIAALHSVNIIHRDIKHSNLLLDSMNRIKIADFGLSAILETESDRKLSFLGTPNFLAPELINRDQRGHGLGVDVWAAGILMYVMLYNRPPFSAQRMNNGTKPNMQSLYLKISENDIEFPPEPLVSYSARNLINRLCCKDERHRLQACDVTADPWFSKQPDSDAVSYMPQDIFERPIGDYIEYMRLVRNDGKAARHATGAMSTATPTNGDGGNRASAGPLTKSIPSSVKRLVSRQPLEPIMENGNRALPVLANIAPKTAAMPYNGVNKQRVSNGSVDRAAPSGDSWIDRGKLHARYTAESTTSEKYMLRPRNANGAVPAATRQPTRENAVPPSSVSRQMQQQPMRQQQQQQQQQQQVRLRSQMQSVADTYSGPPTPASTGCQVQAEFGRVTKLSEGYIPSILKWQGRLQQFCEQTESYLEQAVHDLVPEPYSAASGDDNYPRVGIYVLNWMAMAKYGLGFRLSDKTTGTLFNDNTSLLNVDGEDDYVYLRPFENRSCIGYYSSSKFPEQLEKKRRLLHSFGAKIAKSFSAKVDLDICPLSTPPDVVKCLLQALSTNVGMVFLLTGNVLQFNMHNHSKLFLYKDAHIFYKDSSGKKWHFDLDKGPGRLVSDEAIDMEQFLLCLEYARKVLKTWNFPRPSPAASPALSLPPPPPTTGIQQQQREQQQQQRPRRQVRLSRAMPV